MRLAPESPRLSRGLLFENVDPPLARGFSRASPTCSIFTRPTAQLFNAGLLPDCARLRQCRNAHHAPSGFAPSFLESFACRRCGVCSSPSLLAADEIGTDPHRLTLLSDVHIAADRSAHERGVTMYDHLAKVVVEVAKLDPKPAAAFIKGMRVSPRTGRRLSDAPALTPTAGRASFRCTWRWGITTTARTSGRPSPTPRPT